MMNKSYIVFGKILGAIKKDCPPSISKNFTDRVMSEVHSMSNTKRKSTKGYLNVAASIFFAVITSFLLVNYDNPENNITTSNSQESEKVDNNIIKKVIDSSQCEGKDINLNDNNACK